MGTALRIKPGKSKPKEIKSEKLVGAADYYKQHEIELYIETVKGTKFFMDRPDFDIEVIAAALSKQCRYTGHTRRFFSVAEHSILVMKIMEELGGNPFEGLMHDACEAYLSDIAAPWKALLPDYKKLEAKIEMPMRNHYALPASMTQECRRADWIALFVEADKLMVTKAKDWIAPDDIKDTAARLTKTGLFPIACWHPEQAELLFLSAFKRWRNAP